MNEYENRSGTTASTKNSKKGCFIVFFIFACIVLCGFILILLFILGIIFSSSLKLSQQTVSSEQSLKQIYVSGQKNAKDKIALINIEGIILDSKSSWSKTADIKNIIDQIKTASHDNKIKAVLLSINSPGGEITATDIVHHCIEELKQKKPTVALLGPVAASGGYYIAVASDYIIANRFTTTGSIGVIINSYNYFDLLQKIGVKDEVYKSKEMKDILNPARPRTKAEETIIQALINESYNEFVQIVSKGRIDKDKRLTPKYIKESKIGDGRIFSGTQALELGLIDQLGYFHDAVNKTAEIAGLKESNYQVISYEKQFTFFDVFSRFLTKANSVTVEIPAIKQFNLLESGKLYYLYKEN